MRGCKELTTLYTPKETAHTAAVQTHVCGEHVRHVLRSVVRHCACSALYVCMYVCMYVCSVYAVPCNTVLVCAARSQCGDCLFVCIGERMNACSLDV